MMHLYMDSLHDDYCVVYYNTCLLYTSWKFQRYMRDYMKTVKSLDDNVGRVLFRSTYATLIIFFLATFGMSQVLPSGFIPNEDQGRCV